MSSEKNLITNSRLAEIKAAEAELVDNLYAHANTTLSKAHGFEFYNLPHPTYDSSGNDISIYSDSNGDRAGYYQMRLTYNNVNYYAPLESSILAGKDSLTGLVPASDSTVSSTLESTAWLTDLTVDEQALIASNTSVLLPHFLLSHWETHQAGVYQVLPQIVNDSAGHRVSNYVAKVVVDGRELLIPCDTRIGGPLQAPRLAAACPTAAFTGPVSGSFYMSGLQLIMHVDAGEPWPTSVILTISGITGGFPLTAQWQYKVSALSPWIDIVAASTTIPGVGNGGLTSVSGYTQSVAGPSGTATSTWNIVSPGGDNSNAWYMRCILSNASGSVTSCEFYCYMQDEAGSWLCTVLWKKGDISTEVYEADRRHTMKHVSRAAKEGYTLWAFPLSIQMRRHEWIYRLVKPFVLRWTLHMAYLEGVLENDNFAGKVLFNLVRPICAMIGWPLLKYKRWQRQQAIAAKKSMLSGSSC